MKLNEDMTSCISPVNDTDERAARNKRWLVAETSIHHEKKVRELLRKMGIECFLPSQFLVRQWKYRKTRIEQLLIPMKVFVHIAEHEKARVLNLHLVRRFMSEWKKTTPVVIPDDQMSRFMFMLNSAENPVHFFESSLEPGVKVRVVRGPLQGLVGDFLSMDCHSKIRVGMDVLGYICVEIPMEDVEEVK